MALAIDTVMSLRRATPLDTRWRRNAPKERGKQFVTCTGATHPTLVHENNLVDQRKKTGSVIDDHDRHISLPEHLDSFSQSAVAIAIEVGVWLIENDEDRPAKKRSGQSDALPLAAGKTGAVVPYDGVIALREPLDHRMRRGQLRRLDDIFIRSSFTEAGDVVADCPGEQFNILRQVAEALPKGAGVEVPYVISIDAHATLQGRPRPDQSARQ
jgi:hypothetical protein